MPPSDDRKLVKVVECHHVLWDNRMKEFRDKRLTQHGWKSVAELLDREVDDVMSRWSTLRKQYGRRMTRMRTGNASPEKPWHLMPLLDFLRPCITPRRKKQSSVHNNSSTSTEEIYSSSRSDDSRESSPLVVRLNPVEPPRSSLFYGTPEGIGVPKRPFRKPAPKSITGTALNSSLERKTGQTKEEPSDNPSPVSSPKIQKPEPDVHENSSAPKSEAKLPQTATRSLPLKAKRLKTSSDKTTFSKSNNANPENEKKTKPAGEKPSSSFARSAAVTLEAEKRMKIPAAKPLSSVAKSTSTSFETEKKPRTFGETTLSVAKSTNVSSDSLVPRYDSDEYFLLSLASDFRKMDPRQKLEAKIKIMRVVCEQYLKN